MSVLPTYRAFARPAVGVVAAFLLVSFLLSAGTPATEGAFQAAGTATGQDPCPDPLGLHDYSVVVVLDGNVSVPQVTFSVAFDASVVTQIMGNPPGPAVCTAASEPGSANLPRGNGFEIYPVPARQCTPLPNNQTECTVTSGPYGPVNLSLTSPVPPGYLASVSQSGMTFTIVYYRSLETVALDPSGPTVAFSAEGIDEVRALPMTGLGGPSPTVPHFDWNLTGVGWMFAALTAGPEVNITAAPGAGVGNLSVVASLGASDGGLVAPPASVDLLAVPSTIPSASLNRTILDVGQAVRVAVNGTGAGGYNYTATIDPGLGEATTRVGCQSTPTLYGSVALTCSTSVTYSRIGVAQPVVTLSNGDSSAVWQFPEVTVHSTPSVAFLTGAPVGYVNTTIPLSIEAAAGSGASPYREACLASGSGPALCITTPGPTWTFDPVYPSPGNYSVLAWTVDATGANRSVETTVRVVAPLRLSLTTDPADRAAGVPLPLSAVVWGGDLPAVAWWNATDESSPVASLSLTGDGPFGATYVPPAAGFVVVSLVVVDRLGTVVERSLDLSVAVGPATSVEPAALPTASVSRAGAPISVSWQALDPVGEVVHDFSSPAEVELRGAGSNGTVPGWVNASGIGPLSSRLPGWFDVPPAAWIYGDLNITVSTPLAGPLDVALTLASGLAGGSATVGIVVHADVDHLRLFDPRTEVRAGGVNDTLWQVTDRFGNPAAGATVVVASSFGGSSSRLSVPVGLEPDGSTAVWVNVSTPSSVGGTVTVSDLAGDALLAPIVVPGPPGPFASLLPLLPVLLAAVVGASTSTFVEYRARRPRPLGPDAGADYEAELRRLAEGRATVVDVVRRAGPVDLAGLESAWEPPPGPPDLADWVASLVADGTLGATLGADGVARFCLAADERPGVRVTFDLDAFDRAQVRRDEASADWRRDEPD